ncbi:RNA polymerase I-specific transcription initiation factor RRN3 [Histoplasma capsulatum]|uniref:RNA polymerase I-specific transcription initiation factor RRN3 n=1 Tax=Ajellomyces capsulatus TaxID=5037 RepID=A0A8A1M5A8_AJECA|nr:RNA polymerase I-specific transcription initiation factor RRN3 [Histoplasma capsulatum]
MVSAAPVALVPTLALSSSTRTAANSRAMMATPPTKPKPKPKPSKSILKTHVSTPPASAIGQKRKRVAISDLGLSSDDQDAEEEGNASSPVARTHPPVAKKRARVKFEMDMPSHSNKQQQRQEQDDDDDGDDDGDEKKGIENTRNEKSTAMVREEVRRAIQRHLIGDSEAYDRVKEIFAADPTELEDDGSPVYDLPSPTSLRNHLLGLFSNVSALDGSCSGLVHAVLRSEWLGRDEEYVKLFVRFLGTLAAARGTYLNSVLRVLVHGLRQAGPRTGKLPGYAIVYPSEIYARVHMAIKYIIQLIPAGSGALSPLIASSFPHDTDTAKAHIVYTRNIIKIIDYAPELRSDILALITEKLAHPIPPFPLFPILPNLHRPLRHHLRADHLFQIRTNNHPPICRCISRKFRRPRRPRLQRSRPRRLRPSRHTPPKSPGRIRTYLSRTRPETLRPFLLHRPSPPLHLLLPLARSDHRRARCRHHHHPGLFSLVI